MRLLQTRARADQPPMTPGSSPPGPATANIRLTDESCASSRPVAVPGPLSAGPSVVVVENRWALAEHVPAWEELAAAALEPNLFYEPWMLLPALDTFDRDKELLLILVYVPDESRPKGPPLLGGFFPLERRARCKGLPVSVLRLWQHRHCFFCTPLIRAGQAPVVLKALLAWAATDRRGATIVDLPYVSGDGPFQQLLTDHCNEHDNLTFVDECFTRAVIRPRAGAEAYLEAALSSGARKELRRLRKRLGEQGRLETVTLDQEDDLDRWIDNFLELEAKGWKGQGQSALRSNPAERDYFRRISRTAFERGRLMMLGLELDGRPIALKCNFLAAPGSFAFKIAYDEAFARYSPGVQLELDNVHLLHQRRPELAWMDSCAVSRHFMINRLWMERRTIQSLLLSTGTMGGDLLTASLPLLRWFGRLVLRRRPRNGERA
jgi:CelD/BcsL family acetyltransferase involved in cellulose biosynthesis